ncbi:MAG: hypothetical protein H0W99_12010, partial [Acidobacteria bacterium]|nr:hypothetical protein [Acidobacteriota bacterium]
MISGTDGAHAATITVAAGGDFQAALNTAQAGDTIVLEAGASYIGPFTLPAKPASTDYITIQSSAVAQLPAGTRVSPANAALMPKLLSPGNNQPALYTAPFSHHYKLIGIEFAPLNASVYVREIIRLGDGSLAQNTLEMVPRDLIFDRCYIHAHPTQDTIRGIALNSAETSIINSYISEFHSKGFDAQAIWGWNGPGPFKIINNYLEASGENLGFGGAVPGVVGLIPSDIEIRRNTLSKPLSWRTEGWMIKNLFELKAAQRVVMEGNILENCWANAQAGYAIQLTVRNEEGAASWNTIQDVTIKNNIIRRVGGGINFLGRDGNNYPSGQMSGVRIENNLFEDVSGVKWGGNGNFLQMTTVANVTVDHNTVIHSGPNAAIINAYAATSNAGPNAGFIFKNNIVENNAYGIFGGGIGVGNAAIAVYFPGGVFLKNVMVATPSTIYPVDNFYPALLSEVQFVNSVGGDYRLAPSSPYKRRGTDGKDPGCDFVALYAALPDGVPNPAPSPSPSPT